MFQKAKIKSTRLKLNVLNMLFQNMSYGWIEKLIHVTLNYLPQ